MGIYDTKIKVRSNNECSDCNSLNAQTAHFHANFSTIPSVIYQEKPIFPGVK